MQRRTGVRGLGREGRQPLVRLGALGAPAGVVVGRARDAGVLRAAVVGIAAEEPHVVWVYDHAPQAEVVPGHGKRRGGAVG